MCWVGRRVYFCDWGAPRQARGFCTDHLTAALGHSVDAQRVVDDAKLIVSELMTNAVNAGASTSQLDVRLHRDHLRVLVQDDAAGEPQPQPTTSARAGAGRGLQVVAHLADSWGVSYLSDAKQVWAVLDVAPELTRSVECSLPPKSPPPDGD